MKPFIAIIPARGGSKSIPRKNIKPFLERPLLAWTVDTALASGVFERVILSTEDEEIAAVGRSCGAEVPFLRPAELAGDTAPTVAAIHHLLQQLIKMESYQPDYVMILEPTSPARRVFHIRESAGLLAESGADSLASITVVPHHFVPQKLLCRAENGEISGLDGTLLANMIHRRQDLPQYYALDGNIFASRGAVVLGDPPSLWGKRTVGYPVDAKYNIDLDRPEDWGPSEARLKQILAEEEK
jgi:CMP-N,N'-diacetyllegionaminic acid synthase